MRPDGIFSKYALTLSSIAGEKKELMAVKENLDALTEIFREKKEVFAFLKHPGIPRHEKNVFIDELSEKFDFSKTTREFMKLLCREGRIGCFAEITSKYNTIMMALNKKIKVKVQGVYGQDKKMLARIKTILSEKLGREIILEFSENKDLIGGFRIFAQGHVFDCSLKGELERMGKELL